MGICLRIQPIRGVSAHHQSSVLKEHSYSAVFFKIFKQGSCWTSSHFVRKHRKDLKFIQLIIILSFCFWEHLQTQVYKFCSTILLALKEAINCRQWLKIYQEISWAERPKRLFIEYNRLLKFDKISTLRIYWNTLYINTHTNRKGWLNGTSPLVGKLCHYRATHSTRER